MQGILVLIIIRCVYWCWYMPNIELCPWPIHIKYLCHCLKFYSTPNVQLTLKKCAFLGTWFHHHINILKGKFQQLTHYCAQSADARSACPAPTICVTQLDFTIADTTRIVSCVIHSSHSEVLFECWFCIKNAFEFLCKNRDEKTPPACSIGNNNGPACLQQDMAQRVILDSESCWTESQQASSRGAFLGAFQHHWTY